MTLTTTNGAAAQTEASETDKKILAELDRRRRVAVLRDADWTVQLAGGRTATFIDPEELSERKARAMRVAMMRISRQDPETGLDYMDPERAVDSGYVMVAAFLRSWTVDLPLPAIGNFDSLLDMTAKDFTILSDAVADLRPEVFNDFSTDTPEALADPSSPLGAGGG